MRELRILIINLDGLMSPTSRSSIRHQLGMAALLQTHEPEHRGLDGLPACEQSVILEKSSLLIPKRLGYSDPFVFGENDAAKGGVERNVVVESAGVLRDGVDVAAEGAEGAAIDGVRVCYAVYVWTGCVDGVVDHVCWSMISLRRSGWYRGEYLPAVFRRRTGPPSTTLPSLLTRIKSEAFKRGHATPNGLTQKLVGSTGSWSMISPHSQIQLNLLQIWPQSPSTLVKQQMQRNIYTLKVMCPATPSSNPNLAKILKAKASLPFKYCLSSYLSVKVGGFGQLIEPMLDSCFVACFSVNPGSSGAVPF
jgi:hypothetical protein